MLRTTERTADLDDQVMPTAMDDPAGQQRQAHGDAGGGE
jgi:hypothetical protein